MIKQVLFIGMMAFVALFTTQAKAQTENNVTTTVKNDLHQIYGQSYNMYCSKPAQLQFYVKLYKRIEYIPANQAPQGIKNLSELSLLNKYNPSVIHHDNITQFDAATFNPLKFRFNYYSTQDLYFKIYGTNKVMKVKKNDK